MTSLQDVTTVIQRILQKLISEYAPQKVILFGSHAYGSPGRDSDIDLLIIKETPQRFIDRWTMVSHKDVGIDATRALELGLSKAF